LLKYSDISVLLQVFFIITCKTYFSFLKQFYVYNGYAVVIVSSDGNKLKG